MYCKECGNQIADDSKFCASCRKSQSGENFNSVRERKSIEKLSLWEYYKKCLKNYATFEGRARREEFWGFLLFDTSIKFVIIIIALAMAGETFVDTLSIFLLVATLLPSLAVHIRRLHDIGKSGWWLLFAMFIPIIGQIMGLVWFCTDGEYNENEYGQNPKGDFTKASNQKVEYVSSGIFEVDGKPIRIKNKGSRIHILAIIALFLLVFLFLFKIRESNNRIAEVQEEQRQQQIQLAIEKAQRTADSLIMEDAIKKKAGSSKKTSGSRLAPEQPQEALKIHGISGMKRQKLEK
jgi:uncharacterized membrane protein YhaH (DUF805 family)